jgi:predicted O-methyltransferase YrrM
MKKELEMENVSQARQIVRDIFDRIQGLLEEKEGELLYNIAKDCRAEKGVIVEIGSFKGRSTTCLGKGSKAGNQVRVYAIDPHMGSSVHEFFNIQQTHEEFKKNIKIAGIDDLVFPIFKTSEEAAKIFHEPIEFLFIDGNHEYENVKLDFLSWYPKVIYGGIIAFHDQLFFGPRRVIEKYVHMSKHFKVLGIIDSILYAQKVKKNSLKDRLINILLLFVFRCSGLYHKLPFPKPITKLTARTLGPLKIMK